MAIWDLSRIDIVARTTDGVNKLVTVVSTWDPEALRLVQLAMKLSVYRAYGAELEPFEIEVVSYGAEPPESAVGLVRLAGARISREESQPATGAPGEFGFAADGELDWPAVMAANAASFAAEHGLDGTVDSLRDLDRILEEAYTEAAAEPDDDGDLREDGNLAVLAGAYASQVMLTAFSGMWTASDPRTRLPDFRIQLGPAGDMVVAALGKVRKFLRNGPGDAVHPLAVSVGRRF